MLESRTTLLIAIAIVTVTIVALFLLMRRSRDTQTSVASRLRALAMERDDYSIRIGMPLASPTEWQPVAGITDATLTLQNGVAVSYSDVRAFVVAYSNGQLVESELGDLPLPVGVTGLSSSIDPDHDVIQAEDLVPGRLYIQISYGASPAQPNDSSHYATTLTNVSNEPIMVDRFAGYAKTQKGWRLFTVTKKFYTAEEFKEWYGLGSVDWIAPGESATDSNNYGDRPVLWAYYCRTKSGQQFIAGEILQ